MVRQWSVPAYSLRISLRRGGLWAHRNPNEKEHRPGILPPQPHRHPIQQPPVQNCLHHCRREQRQSHQGTEVATFDPFHRRHFVNAGIVLLIQQHLLAERPRQRLHQRRVGSCSNRRHAMGLGCRNALLPWPMPEAISTGTGKLLTELMRPCGGWPLSR